MKLQRFFAAALLSLAACTAKNPVLTVEGGQVQGVPSENPEVLVFKGIPYAAPPVGDLRWQAPQPVTPWEGVRTCDTFGDIAWQPGAPPGTFYYDEYYWEGTPDQNEDCLYLNVWAPSATVGKSDAKLPVAMWIHGGGYMNGYGFEVSMDGDKWAERGVILVTINYRLGTFGFLSHPELTAEQGQSGNYGTMDQIAALQWVHDNIAAFGGDPDRITVFGQSAGAMSVKNLLTSPLSRGLFAGAIIQSGGGVGLRLLSPTESTPQSFYDEQGKAIMDHSGLTDLSLMREASAETVFAASGKYSADGKGWVMLSPHIDGKVLTEDFDQALYDGSLAPVPIMIGYNKDDMGLLAGEPVDRFCAVRDSLGFPVYEYEFLRELPCDDAHPDSDQPGPSIPPSSGTCSAPSPAAGVPSPKAITGSRKRCWMPGPPSARMGIPVGRPTSTTSRTSRNSMSIEPTRHPETFRQQII